MELFTKVDLPEPGFNIDYTQKLAFFGSCFADNIAAQFAMRKFQVLSNPFGTVYNPLSIERQLREIADGKIFGEVDVFQDARGPWHSWLAHSSLSAASREECIAKLNAAAEGAREFLKQAEVVFVTLGTSFVYYLKETGEAAANCHRQDPRLFERRMITVEEATQALENIVLDLRKINPESHIVFTVSPLRHMGDGAHGNNLSKATLMLAVEKAIAGMQAHANPLEYFPSYEIVMDELRDYRFYESDMIHLSKTAEEYIFERMVETYCDMTAYGNIARVEKFMKEANHRVSDMHSPAATTFAQKAIAQAENLEKSIPGLDLVAEIAKFRKILNNS
ncbi:MAG: GSCFA domain-containing protein [Fibrobacter sp.]|uniref:GSCFA domain-containing protein n=1 Tax=Fibrobacter sp. TaxID=35828 RepID=UPI0025C631F6|nr:GSCFA domain-containing protein [Fibrobacter sp.]MBR4786171.1 GSCFA domain-containing protein [Fibrobacter sp.]